MMGIAAAVMWVVLIVGVVGMLPRSYTPLLSASGAEGEKEEVDVGNDGVVYTGEVTTIT